MKNILLVIFAFIIFLAGIFFMRVRVSAPNLVESQLFGKNAVTPTPTLIPTPTSFVINQTTNLERAVSQLNPEDLSSDLINLRQETTNLE